MTGGVHIRPRGRRSGSSGQGGLSGARRCRAGRSRPVGGAAGGCAGCSGGVRGPHTAGAFRWRRPQAAPPGWTRIRSSRFPCPVRGLAFPWSGTRRCGHTAAARWRPMALGATDRLPECSSGWWRAHPVRLSRWRRPRAAPSGSARDRDRRSRWSGASRRRRLSGAPGPALRAGCRVRPGVCMGVGRYRPRRPSAGFPDRAFRGAAADSGRGRRRAGEVRADGGSMSAPGAVWPGAGRCGLTGARGLRCCRRCPRRRPA